MSTPTNVSVIVTNSIAAAYGVTKRFDWAALPRNSATILFLENTMTAGAHIFMSHSDKSAH